jgi:hypothetical protein
MDQLVLSEEEIQKLYNWVDEIPLSRLHILNLHRDLRFILQRPKKNINRDFSDGGFVTSEVAELNEE